MVGRSLASVRLWRRSATFPAAVGRTGSSEDVRDALCVEAKRTGEEGGPGEVAFDGDDGVLRAVTAASVPFMTLSGSEDVARSGRGSKYFGRGNA